MIYHIFEHIYLIFLTVKTFENWLKNAKILMLILPTINEFGYLYIYA